MVFLKSRIMDECLLAKVLESLSDRVMILNFPGYLCLSLTQVSVVFFSCKASHRRILCNPGCLGGNGQTHSKCPQAWITLVCQHSGFLIPRCPRAPSTPHHPKGVQFNAITYCIRLAKASTCFESNTKHAFKVHSI